MKKIAVFFTSLAFLMSSIGISVVHAAGAATLSLSPTNTTVRTGDSFVLSVTLTPNGESIDTARVELDWDAAKLEVLAVEKGSLFPNESPANTKDNVGGGLSYGFFKFGTPVSTTGTMASVTLRALSAGSTNVVVLGSSKLIADGSEKMNGASLGSATITITGANAAPTVPVVQPTPTPSPAPSTPAVDLTPEQQALKYFGAMAGRLPSNGDDWTALKCISAGGCQGNPRNLAREGEALKLFGAKYGSLPKTSMEWNVIHAIAYTNVFIKWPGETPKPTPAPVVTPVVPATPTAPVTSADPKADEKMALKYFGAFFGRMPSSGNDWKALNCMAYGGCQGNPRDIAKEKEALKTFGAKYGKMPANAVEWNVLHTIAYTDLLLAHAKPAVATPAAPAVPATPVAPAAPTELTLEQQAVGWFGKLAGRLPSSDKDWKAVNYMVNGYSPETQNLDAEASAIKTFSAKFGKLPSSDQDWNIIAAIAYSGAF